MNRKEMEKKTKILSTGQHVKYKPRAKNQMHVSLDWYIICSKLVTNKWLLWLFSVRKETFSFLS